MGGALVHMWIRINYFAGYCCFLYPGRKEQMGVSTFIRRVSVSSFGPLAFDLDSVAQTCTFGAATRCIACMHKKSSAASTGYVVEIKTRFSNTLRKQGRQKLCLGAYPLRPVANKYRCSSDESKYLF